jgi:SAM-dependent methyltransferase
MESTDYGNWVPRRLILAAAAVSIIFLLPVLFFDQGILFYIFVVLTLLSALITLLFFSARRFLAKSNGEFQVRLRDLVLDHLDWDGRGQALDIGCGNGPLTIGLARKYPQARVTGIDYWGGMWDYSLKACQDNAEAEGVGGRTEFKKADAASLPFEDAVFEAAVSTFVFHEVKSAKDKKDVIKEALRVVKKGGVFSFQDLFLSKRIYGDIGSLLQELRESGLEDVAFEDTSRLEFIPAYLRLPFLLGRIGIIYGRK